LRSLQSIPFVRTDWRVGRSHERGGYLEKQAEVGKVDDFFEAIDSDDFGKAKSLMRKAGFDPETIATVLKKMNETDGER
jgi:hypothetical protein